MTDWGWSYNIYKSVFIIFNLKNFNFLLGSHGSGDDSERLTPFVTWGAGIEPKPYGNKTAYSFF